MQTRSKNRDRPGKGIALPRPRPSLVVALCCAILGVPGIPAAQARPSDPFEPYALVSLASRTAGQGANTLEVTSIQAVAGCYPLRPQQVVDDCWRPNTSPFDPAPSTYYGEQNLRRLTLDLPPGLAIDANANRHFCDPYQSWVLGPNEQWRNWVCRDPESLLGVVWLRVSGCVPTIDDPNYFGCTMINPSGTYHELYGLAYNERPRQSEQGRIVILWPGGNGTGQPDEHHYIRADVSVKVRESDLGVSTLADDIPEALVETYRDKNCYPYGPLPENEPPCDEASWRVTPLIGSEPSGLVFVLNAGIGAERGHPLIANATSCDPEATGVGLQGYEWNTVDRRRPDSTFIPASGNGKEKSFTFPYQPTGCEEVPYTPKLSLEVGDNRPNQASAINATVTQPSPANERFVDEQTTEGSTVTFPAVFKANVQNRSTFCPKEDLEARSCPESSKVGEVAARSRLLQEGHVITGGVYLAGLSGDSVKIAVLLEGTVQDGAAPTRIRIDADARLLAEGRLQTTFDNLPKVPISEFTLHLDGGSKGLLRTPKLCGSYAVASEFRSHAGKVVKDTHPVQIAGCNAPRLEAELSSRRPKARTNLHLALGSTGVRLKGADLLLDRDMRFAIKNVNAAKAKSKSVGQAVFTTSQGERRLPLKANRTRNGGLRLSALKKTGALSGFSASLFRSAKERTAKHRRTTRAQARLKLAGLPADDLIAVELSLTGKRGKLSLRNPKHCKRPVKFAARVRTAEGRRLALRDEVRLRGKECRKGSKRG